MLTPILITPVDNRLELLPYHIRYYGRLGVTRFVYALWNGQANPVYPELLRIWKEWSPAGATMSVESSIDCDYDHYCGPAETPRLNAIRKQLMAEHGPDAWYCIADADEFYAFYSLCAPSLSVLVDALIAGGYYAAGGVFHDRISARGDFPPLPPIEERRFLDDVFPVAADLTRMAYATSPTNDILPACITKVGLARLDVAIQSGHHGVEVIKERLLRDALECHHFKWHAGTKDLLPRRLKAYRAQGLAWAGETEWFMNFFAHPNWATAPCLNARPARRLGI